MTSFAFFGIVDDKVAWTLADLFMAGAETTSTTLRWFMLYLVEYPGVQEKIQEEINSVVGDGRLPCLDDKRLYFDFDIFSNSSTVFFLYASIALRFRLLKLEILYFCHLLVITRYSCCHRRMPYTEAAIWEVWRLLTVAPEGLERIATKDVVVAGYKIPKVAS